MNSLRPLHGQPRLAYLVSIHPYLSQSFILREVLGLRRLGLDVDVISISAPDRPPNEMSAEERAEVARTWYVKSAGLAVWLRAHLALLFTHPLRYLRAFGAALRLGGWQPVELLYHLFYFLEAGVVYWRLRRTGHTHVHAHFVSAVGVLVPRYGPVDLSITVHGSDEFYDATRYRVADKIHAASLIRVVSTFNHSQLMRITGQWDRTRFAVVRLGVDPDRFPPAAFRPAPDPFTILCVGRLVVGKGQRDLILAVDGLRRKGRNVLLRLVGDGPDRTALEEFVARLGLHGTVRLEGGVNQDRILDYYQAADLFVLPSYAEGLPVVLMEAMAAGVACVASRIGGIPELIEDGESGLLVTASDVGALETAMEKLVADPALRRRLAEAGRARVVEDYDLDTNVATLAALFRERLAR